MKARTSPFKKSLALAMAFVIFTGQCVLSHALEVNFWSERRKATSPLPSPQNVSIWGPGINKSGFPITTFGNDGLANLQKFGTVRKISARDSSAPLVLHIQDVHENTEAQSNIAQAVRQLIESGRVDVVALEGSHGPIDVEKLRSFPHPATVKKVADYLLAQNKISGPIHAALSSEPSSRLPFFMGVDDPAHYEKNVEAYRQAAPLMQEAKKQWGSRSENLTQRKKQQFNSKLKEWDQAVEAYRSGTLTLGPFIERLKPSGKFPELQKFQKAYRLEQSLDFARAEAERSHLISLLFTKLTDPEKQLLVAQSLALRSGRLAPRDFYRDLIQLLDSKGLRTESFPRITSYFDYLTVSDALDGEVVMNELRLAEAAAYESIIKTTDERALVEESRRHHLQGKLLDFALTKGEWEEYKKGVPGAWYLVPRSFENFYWLAEARDQKMAQNILHLKTRNQALGTSLVVLVTGGFHSDGIDRALMKAGYRVASFTPKISKVDTASGSAYLTAFTQEKTPLDQLFEGDKLFLSKPGLSKASFNLAMLLMLAEGFRLGLQNIPNWTSYAWTKAGEHACRLLRPRPVEVRYDAQFNFKGVVLVRSLWMLNPKNWGWRPFALPLPVPAGWGIVPNGRVFWLPIPIKPSTAVMSGVPGTPPDPEKEARLLEEWILSELKAKGLAFSSAARYVGTLVESTPTQLSMQTLNLVARHHGGPQNHLQVMRLGRVLFLRASAVKLLGEDQLRARLPAEVSLLVMENVESIYRPDPRARPNQDTLSQIWNFYGGFIGHGTTPPESTLGVLMAIQRLQNRLPGRTFIDFGAETGIVGLMAACMNPGKVIYLERDHKIIRELQDNIERGPAHNHQLNFFPNEISDQINGSVLAINIGGDFGIRTIEKILENKTPEVLIISGGKAGRADDIQAFIQHKGWTYETIHVKRSGSFLDEFDVYPTFIMHTLKMKPAAPRPAASEPQPAQFRVFDALTSRLWFLDPKNWKWRRFSLPVLVPAGHGLFPAGLSIPLPVPEKPLLMAGKPKGPKKPAMLKGPEGLPGQMLKFIGEKYGISFDVSKSEVKKGYWVHFYDFTPEQQQSLRSMEFPVSSTNPRIGMLFEGSVPILLFSAGLASQEIIHLVHGIHSDASFEERMQTRARIAASPYQFTFGVFFDDDIQVPVNNRSIAEFLKTLPEVGEASLIAAPLVREMDFHGTMLVRLSQVFSSDHETSTLLRETVRPKKLDDVLEMGAGAGMTGFEYKRQGTRRVVLADQSVQAQLTAEFNRDRLKLGKTVEVVGGDMFENLEGRRFDEIAFDPPYPVPEAYKEQTGDFSNDVTWADPDMKTMTRFLTEAHDHLKPGGVLRVVYISIPAFYELCYRLGWEPVSLEIRPDDYVPDGKYYPAVLMTLAPIRDKAARRGEIERTIQRFHLLEELYRWRRSDQPASQELTDAYFKLRQDVVALLRTDPNLIDFLSLRALAPGPLPRLLFNEHYPERLAEARSQSLRAATASLDHFELGSTFHDWFGSFLEFNPNDIRARLIDPDLTARPLKKPGEDMVEIQASGSRPAVIHYDQEALRVLAAVQNQIETMITTYPEKWKKMANAEATGLDRFKRAYEVRLPEPVLFRGKLLTRVVVNGIAFTKENFDRKVPYMMPSVGTTARDSMSNEEQKAVMQNQVELGYNAQGERTSQRKPVSLMGGHSFPEARQKFNNARTLLPTLGLEGPIALGYGEYPGMEMDGVPLGFFISAETDEPEEKLAKIIHHQYELFLNELAEAVQAFMAEMGELINFPGVEDQFKDRARKIMASHGIPGLFKAYGRYLRELSDAGPGVYPYQPHGANISIKKSSDGRPVWRSSDVGDWKTGDDMTPEQKFSYQYFTLSVGVTVAARDVMNWPQMKRLYQNGIFDPLTDVVRGFFHDKLEHPHFKSSEVRLYANGTNDVQLAVWTIGAPPIHTQTDAPFVRLLREMHGMDQPAGVKSIIRQPIVPPGDVDPVTQRANEFINSLPPGPLKQMGMAMQTSDAAAILAAADTTSAVHEFLKRKKKAIERKVTYGSAEDLAEDLIKVAKAFVGVFLVCLTAWMAWSHPWQFLAYAPLVVVGMAVQGERMLLFSLSAPIVAEIKRSLSRSAHQLVGIVTHSTEKEVIQIANQSDIRVFSGDPLLDSRNVVQDMRENADFRQKVTAFAQQLSILDPTVNLTAIFNYLPRILRFARHNLNVHPTPLPHYPGGYPLEAMILAGETETAVTIHEATERSDAGHILLQQNHIPIEPDDTKLDLMDKVALRTGSMVLEALDRLATGNYSYRPQGKGSAKKIAWGIRTRAVPNPDGSRTVYNDGLLSHIGIDWDTFTTERIVRLVRAFGQDTVLTPFTNRGRKRFYLLHAAPSVASAEGRPGEVLRIDRHQWYESVLIKTMDGAVRVEFYDTRDLKKGDVLKTRDKVSVVTRIPFTDRETIIGATHSGHYIHDAFTEGIFLFPAAVLMLMTVGLAISFGWRAPPETILLLLHAGPLVDALARRLRASLFNLVHGKDSLAANRAIIPDLTENEFRQRLDRQFLRFDGLARRLFTAESILAALLYTAVDTYGLNSYHVLLLGTAGLALRWLVTSTDHAFRNYYFFTHGPSAYAPVGASHSSTSPGFDFEKVETGSPLDHPERQRNIEVLAKETGRPVTEIAPVYDIMVRDMAARIKNNELFPAGINEMKIKFLNIPSHLLGIVPIPSEPIVTITLTRYQLVVQRLDQEPQAYEIVGKGRSLSVKTGNEVVPLQDFIQTMASIPLQEPLERYFDVLETGGVVIPADKGGPLQTVRAGDQASLTVTNDGYVRRTAVVLDENIFKIPVTFGYHYHPHGDADLSDGDVAYMERRAASGQGGPIVDIVFANTGDQSFNAISYSNFFPHVTLPMTLPSLGVRMVGHMYRHEEGYGTFSFIRELLELSDAELREKAKTDKFVSQAFDPLKTFLPTYRDQWAMVGKRITHLYEFMHYHLTRGNKLAEFWGRLGLEKEYRATFKTEEEFWSSGRSLVDVYRQLKNKGDRVTLAEAGLRSAGVLFPIHSARSRLTAADEEPEGLSERERMIQEALSGDFGTGDLVIMKKVVDFLSYLQQRILQLLPFNWSSAGNSPFSVASSKLIDPVFINIQDLRQRLIAHGCPTTQLDDYLVAHADDIKRLRSGSEVQYDDEWKEGILYIGARRLKTEALRAAWADVQEAPGSVLMRNFEQYQSSLEKTDPEFKDHVLYVVLKDHFMQEELRTVHWTQSQQWDWRTWPQSYRERSGTSLEEARQRFKAGMDFEFFRQYVLSEQLNDFVDHANKNGVALKFDKPVAYDGADVWIHPELFGLSAANGFKRLTVMGVPPDMFNKQVGQVWQFFTLMFSHPEAIPFLLKQLVETIVTFLRLDHELKNHRVFNFTTDLEQVMTLKNLGLYEPFERLRLAANALNVDDARRQAARRAEWLLELAVWRLQKLPAEQSEDLTEKERLPENETWPEIEQAYQEAKQNLLSHPLPTDDQLKNAFPDGALALLFDEKGRLRDDHLILISRHIPDDETHPAPDHWENLPDVEQLVFNRKKWWQLLRATPNKQADDPEGRLFHYLFPDKNAQIGLLMQRWVKAKEEGREDLADRLDQRLAHFNEEPVIQETDGLRLGYFTLSPGDEIVSQYLETAQRAGKVLVMELLGTVPPDVFNSYVNLLAFLLVPVIYGMEEKEAYYPAKITKQSAVSFSLHDSDALSFAWKNYLTPEKRRNLFQGKWPDGTPFWNPVSLGRNWSNKDLWGDITPEVHEFILGLAYNSQALMSVLSMHDVLNDGKRPNEPGKLNQWKDRVEPTVEELDAASQEALKWTPLSVFSGGALRATSLIYKLSRQSGRAVHRLPEDKTQFTNMSVGGGIQLRKFKSPTEIASPFLVDAFLHNHPAEARVSLVITRNGQVVDRVPMTKRAIHPDSFIGGLPSTVSKWRAEWSPTEPGRYQVHAEVDGTGVSSESGFLDAAPADADLRPLSPQYFRSADPQRGGALGLIPWLITVKGKINPRLIQWVTMLESWGLIMIFILNFTAVIIVFRMFFMFEEIRIPAVFVLTWARNISLALNFIAIAGHALIHGPTVIVKNSPDVAAEEGLYTERKADWWDTASLFGGSLMIHGPLAVILPFLMQAAYMESEGLALPVAGVVLFILSLGTILGHWIFNRYRKMRTADFQGKPLLTVPALVTGPMDNTPAHDILTAFGLGNPEDINRWTVDEAEFEDGRIRHIRIPNGVSPGIALLNKELHGRNEYKLLTNSQGRLLAVVPVPTSEALHALTSESHDLDLSYLNLNDYYFEIPEIGHPQAAKAWKALALEQERSRDLITGFIKENLPRHTRDIVPRYQTGSIHYHEYSERTMNYVYAEIDRETGSLHLESINPRKFEKNAHRWNARLDGTIQLIFPVLPSVYPPQNFIEADDQYRRSIWKFKQWYGLHRRGLSDEDNPMDKEWPTGNRILVPFAGTGIDSWLAYHAYLQATGRVPQITSVDANPLAIANIKIFARLAGISINAQLGTAETVQGEFDLVFAGMPAYHHGGDRHREDKLLASQHDGDDRGETLKGFTKRLMEILEPIHGFAIAWNVASYDRYNRDRVEIIFSSGGEELEEDNPEWPERALDVTADNQGQGSNNEAVALYFVSRPRTQPLTPVQKFTRYLSAIETIVRNPDPYGYVILIEEIKKELPEDTLALLETNRDAVHGGSGSGAHSSTAMIDVFMAMALFVHEHMDADMPEPLAQKWDGLMKEWALWVNENKPMYEKTAWNFRYGYLSSPLMLHIALSPSYKDQALLAFNRLAPRGADKPSAFQDRFQKLALHLWSIHFAGYIMEDETTDLVSAMKSYEYGLKRLRELEGKTGLAAEKERTEWALAVGSFLMALADQPDNTPRKIQHAVGFKDHRQVLWDRTAEARGVWYTSREKFWKLSEDYGQEIGLCLNTLKPEVLNNSQRSWLAQRAVLFINLLQTIPAWLGGPPLEQRMIGYQDTSHPFFKELVGLFKGDVFWRDPEGLIYRLQFLEEKLGMAAGSTVSVSSGDRGTDIEIFHVPINGRTLELHIRSGERVVKSDYYTNAFLKHMARIKKSFDDRGKKVRRGIEFGTGRGTVAICQALTFLCHTVAADVNAQALVLAQQNAQRNRVTAPFETRHGDTSDVLKENEVFDSVMFTLPTTVITPEMASGMDIHQMQFLNGGLDGRRNIDRVIEKINPHVSMGGALHFMISSFIGVDQTLELLRKNGFHPKVFATERKYLDETVHTANTAPYIEKQLNYKFPVDENGRRYFELVLIEGVKVRTVTHRREVQTMVERGLLTLGQADEINRDVDSGALVLSGESINVIGPDNLYAGPIDKKIAVKYGLDRDVAVVFILTPEGTTFVFRRAPHVDQPLKMGVLSGGVNYGESPLQAAFREIAEEAGFDEAHGFPSTYHPQGLMEEIGRETTPEVRHTRRTFFVYRPNEKESAALRRLSKDLDRKKVSLSRAEYTQWLKDEGHEAWGIMELPGHMVRAVYRNPAALQLVDEFKDGVREPGDVKLIDGLNHTFQNLPQVMEKFERLAGVSAPSVEGFFDFVQKKFLSPGAFEKSRQRISDKWKSGAYSSDVTAVFEDPEFLFPEIIDLLQSQTLAGDSIDLMWLDLVQAAASTYYKSAYDMAQAMDPKRADHFLSQVIAESLSFINLTALVLLNEADRNPNGLRLQLDELLKDPAARGDNHLLNSVPSFAEFFILATSDALQISDYTIKNLSGTDPGEFFKMSRRHIWNRWNTDEGGRFQKITRSAVTEIQLGVLEQGVSSWPLELLHEYRPLNITAMLHHLDSQMAAQYLQMGTLDTLGLNIRNDLDLLVLSAQIADFLSDYKAGVYQGKPEVEIVFAYLYLMSPFLNLQFNQEDIGLIAKEGIEHHDRVQGLHEFFTWQVMLFAVTMSHLGIPILRLRDVMYRTSAWDSWQFMGSPMLRPLPFESIRLKAMSYISVLRLLPGYRLFQKLNAMTWSGFGNRGDAAGIVFTPNLPRLPNTTIDPNYVLHAGPIKETNQALRQLVLMVSSALMAFHALLLFNILQGGRAQWMDVWMAVGLPWAGILLMSFYQVYLHWGRVVVKIQYGFYDDRPATVTDRVKIFFKMFVVFSPFALWSSTFIGLEMVAVVFPLPFWRAIVLVSLAYAVIFGLSYHTYHVIIYLHKRWNRTVRPADDRTGFGGDATGIVLKKPEDLRDFVEEKFLSPGAFEKTRQIVLKQLSSASVEPNFYELLESRDLLFPEVAELLRRHKLADAPIDLMWLLLNDHTIYTNLNNALEWTRHMDPDNRDDRLSRVITECASFINLSALILITEASGDNKLRQRLNKRLKNSVARGDNALLNTVPSYSEMAILTTSNVIKSKRYMLYPSLPATSRNILAFHGQSSTGVLEGPFEEQLLAFERRTAKWPDELRRDYLALNVAAILHHLDIQMLARHKPMDNKGLKDVNDLNMWDNRVLSDQLPEVLRLYQEGAYDNRPGVAIVFPLAHLLRPSLKINLSDDEWAAIEQLAYEQQNALRGFQEVFSWHFVLNSTLMAHEHHRTITLRDILERNDAWADWQRSEAARNRTIPMKVLYFKEDRSYASLARDLPGHRAHQIAGAIPARSTKRSAAPDEGKTRRTVSSSSLQRPSRPKGNLHFGRLSKWLIPIYVCPPWVLQLMDVKTYISHGIYRPSGVSGEFSELMERLRQLPLYEEARAMLVRLVQGPGIVLSTDLRFNREVLELVLAHEAGHYFLEFEGAGLYKKELVRLSKENEVLRKVFEEVKSLGIYDDSEISEEALVNLLVHTRSGGQYSLEIVLAALKDSKVDFPLLFEGAHQRMAVPSEFVDDLAALAENVYQTHVDDALLPYERLNPEESYEYLKSGAGRDLSCLPNLEIEGEVASIGQVRALKLIAEARAQIIVGENGQVALVNFFDDAGYSDLPTPSDQLLAESFPVNHILEGTIQPRHVESIDGRFRVEQALNEAEVGDKELTVILTEGLSSDAVQQLNQVLNRTPQRRAVSLAGTFEDAPALEQELKKRGFRPESFTRIHILASEKAPLDSPFWGQGLDWAKRALILFIDENLQVRRVSSPDERLLQAVLSLKSA